MFLSENPPGNHEAEDGFYLGSGSKSESKELESDDGFQGVDVDPELAPTPQATNHDNATEAADAEELADNSPLLNHTEQVEGEGSQDPGLQLEIEEFGGKAGQPIRVGRPTTTNGRQTRSSDDPSSTNPYAPFHSQTDWEVAKWGKLRGPTSTAFTELLEIPNVSS